MGDSIQYLIDVFDDSVLERHASRQLVDVAKAAAETREKHADLRNSPLRGKPVKAEDIARNLDTGESTDEKNKKRYKCVRVIVDDGKSDGVRLYVVRRTHAHEFGIHCYVDEGYWKDPKLYEAIRKTVAVINQKIVITHRTIIFHDSPSVWATTETVMHAMGAVPVWHMEPRLHGLDTAAERLVAKYMPAFSVHMTSSEERLHAELIQKIEQKAPDQTPFYTALCEYVSDEVVHIYEKRGRLQNSTEEHTNTIRSTFHPMSIAREAVVYAGEALAMFEILTFIGSGNYVTTAAIGAIIAVLGHQSHANIMDPLNPSQGMLYDLIRAVSPKDPKDVDKVAVKRTFGLMALTVLSDFGGSYKELMKAILANPLTSASLALREFAGRFIMGPRPLAEFIAKLSASTATDLVMTSLMPVGLFTFAMGAAGTQIVKTLAQRVLSCITWITGAAITGAALLAIPAHFTAHQKYNEISLGTTTAVLDEGDASPRFDADKTYQPQTTSSWYDAWDMCCITHEPPVEGGNKFLSYTVVNDRLVHIDPATADGVWLPEMLLTFDQVVGDMGSYDQVNIPNSTLRFYAPKPEYNEEHGVNLYFETQIGHAKYMYMPTPIGEGRYVRRPAWAKPQPWTTKYAELVTIPAPSRSAKLDLEWWKSLPDLWRASVSSTNHMFDGTYATLRDAMIIGTTAAIGTGEMGSGVTAALAAFSTTMSNHEAGAQLGAFIDVISGYENITKVLQTAGGILESVLEVGDHARLETDSTLTSWARKANVPLLKGMKVLGAMDEIALAERNAMTLNTVFGYINGVAAGIITDIWADNPDPALEKYVKFWTTTTIAHDYDPSLFRYRPLGVFLYRLAELRADVPALADIVTTDTLRNGLVEPPNYLDKAQQCYWRRAMSNPMAASREIELMLGLDTAEGWIRYAGDAYTHGLNMLYTLDDASVQMAHSIADVMKANIPETHVRNAVYKTITTLPVKAKRFQSFDGEALCRTIVSGVRSSKRLKVKWWALSRTDAELCDLALEGNRLITQRVETLALEMMRAGVEKAVEMPLAVLEEDSAPETIVAHPIVVLYKAKVDIIAKAAGILSSLFGKAFIDLSRLSHRAKSHQFIVNASGQLQDVDFCRVTSACNSERVIAVRSHHLSSTVFGTPEALAALVRHCENAKLAIYDPRGYRKQIYEDAPSATSIPREEISKYFQETIAYVEIIGRDDAHGRYGCGFKPTTTNVDAIQNYKYCLRIHTPALSIGKPTRMTVAQFRKSRSDTYMTIGPQGFSTVQERPDMEFNSYRFRHMNVDFVGKPTYSIGFLKQLRTIDEAYEAGVFHFEDSSVPLRGVFQYIGNNWGMPASFKDYTSLTFGTTLEPHTAAVWVERIALYKQFELPATHGPYDEGINNVLKMIALSDRADYTMGMRRTRMAMAVNGYNLDKEAFYNSLRSLGTTPANVFSGTLETARRLAVTPDINRVPIFSEMTLNALVTMPGQAANISSAVETIYATKINPALFRRGQLNVLMIQRPQGIQFAQGLSELFTGEVPDELAKTPVLRHLERETLPVPLKIAAVKDICDALENDVALGPLVTVYTDSGLSPTVFARPLNNISKAPNTLQMAQTLLELQMNQVISNVCALRILAEHGSSVAMSARALELQCVNALGLDSTIDTRHNICRRVMNGALKHTNLSDVDRVNRAARHSETVTVNYKELKAEYIGDTDTTLYEQQLWNLLDIAVAFDVPLTNRLKLMIQYAARLDMNGDRIIAQLRDNVSFENALLSADDEPAQPPPPPPPSQMEAYQPGSLSTIKVSKAEFEALRQRYAVEEKKPTQEFNPETEYYFWDSETNIMVRKPIDSSEPEAETEAEIEIEVEVEDVGDIIRTNQNLFKPTPEEVVKLRGLIRRFKSKDLDPGLLATVDVANLQTEAGIRYEACVANMLHVAFPPGSPRAIMMHSLVANESIPLTKLSETAAVCNQAAVIHPDPNVVSILTQSAKPLSVARAISRLDNSSHSKFLLEIAANHVDSDTIILENSVFAKKPRKQRRCYTTREEFMRQVSDHAFVEAAVPTGFYNPLYSERYEAACEIFDNALLTSHGEERVLRKLIANNAIEFYEYEQAMRHYRSIRTRGVNIEKIVTVLDDIHVDNRTVVTLLGHLNKLPEATIAEEIDGMASGTIPSFPKQPARNVFDPIVYAYTGARVHIEPLVGYLKSIVPDKDSVQHIHDKANALRDRIADAVVEVGKFLDPETLLQNYTIPNMHEGYEFVRNATEMQDFMDRYPGLLWRNHGDYFKKIVTSTIYPVVESVAYMRILGINVSGELLQALILVVANLALTYVLRGCRRMLQVVKSSLESVTRNPSAELLPILERESRMAKKTSTSGKIWHVPERKLTASDSWLCNMDAQNPVVGAIMQYGCFDRKSATRVAAMLKAAGVTKIEAKFISRPRVLGIVPSMAGFIDVVRIPARPYKLVISTDDEKIAKLVGTEPALFSHHFLDYIKGSRDTTLAEYKKKFPGALAVQCVLPHLRTDNSDLLIACEALLNAYYAEFEPHEISGSLYDVVEPNTIADWNMTQFTPRSKRYSIHEVLDSLPSDRFKFMTRNQFSLFPEQTSNPWNETLGVVLDLTGRFLNKTLNPVIEKLDDPTISTHQRQNGSHYILASILQKGLVTIDGVDLNYNETICHTVFNQAGTEQYLAYLNQSLLDPYTPGLCLTVYDAWTKNGDTSIHDLVYEIFLGQLKEINASDTKTAAERTAEITQFIYKHLDGVVRNPANLEGWDLNAALGYIKNNMHRVVISSEGLQKAARDYDTSGHKFVYNLNTTTKDTLLPQQRNVVTKFIRADMDDTSILFTIDALFVTPPYTQWRDVDVSTVENAVDQVVALYKDMTRQLREDPSFETRVMAARRFTLNQLCTLKRIYDLVRSAKANSTKREYFNVAARQNYLRTSTDLRRQNLIALKSDPFLIQKDGEIRTNRPVILQGVKVESRRKLTGESSEYADTGRALCVGLSMCDVVRVYELLGALEENPAIAKAEHESLLGLLRVKMNPKLAEQYPYAFDLLDQKTTTSIFNEPCTGLQLLQYFAVNYRFSKKFTIALEAIYPGNHLYKWHVYDVLSRITPFIQMDVIRAQFNRILTEAEANPTVIPPVLAELTKTVNFDIPVLGLRLQSKALRAFVDYTNETWYKTIAKNLDFEGYGTVKDNENIAVAHIVSLSDLKTMTDTAPAEPLKLYTASVRILQRYPGVTNASALRATLGVAFREKYNVGSYYWHALYADMKAVVEEESSRAWDENILDTMRNNNVTAFGTQFTSRYTCGKDTHTRFVLGGLIRYFLNGDTFLWGTQDIRERFIALLLQHRVEVTLESAIQSVREGGGVLA